MPEIGHLERPISYDITFSCCFVCFRGFFNNLNLPTEGEPRAEARVRVRRNVVRVRENEAAIRIRIDVRTATDTASIVSVIVAIAVVQVPLGIVGGTSGGQCITEPTKLDTRNAIISHIQSLHRALGFIYRIVDMINCVDRVRGLANTLIFLERGETCNVSGDVIHPFIVTGHEVLNTKDYVADVRAAILPRYVAESVEVVSAGRVLRATTISGISLNISFTCQSHYEVGYIFRHFVVDSMIAFSAHFASCPACGGVELMHRGFGTERIEDDIKLIFPEAKVARMDLDTTRTRTAYEKIIADFEQGKTGILIGTQMVSKGLDFDHVSVVGILNADTMLNFPDFRSYERAFQLMAQVAGRAGRKNKQGLVILQTKSPDLPVIHQVIHNDYEQLYYDQLAERQMFKYPPYYRLIYVYLKHRKEDVLDLAADTMAAQLRSGLGDRVLGPDKPPVARIQALFIKKMIVKVEQAASMAKVRDYLLAVQRAILEDERFRSLLVYYDVDPQ